MTDKIIEWIVFQFSIQPFTNDSNSRNNQVQGFRNSQMDMSELCMSPGFIFLRNLQVMDSNSRNNQS